MWFIVKRVQEIWRTVILILPLLTPIVTNTSQKTHLHFVKIKNQQHITHPKGFILWGEFLFRKSILLKIFNLEMVGLKLNMHRPWLLNLASRSAGCPTQTSSTNTINVALSV